MEETEACPICDKLFPVLELIVHVDQCGTNSIDVDSQHDDDLALARRLQQEEAASGRGSVACQRCNTRVDINSIYILDECGHKFCKSCLKEYVTSTIATNVTIVCPLKNCTKELSVRDMQDLLPEIKQSYASKGSSHEILNPTKGSGQATERIMSEFKHIMKSHPEKNGYSVKPIDDNIYKWKLKLFDFDVSDPLGQDMKTYKVKHILLHITFPVDYPFSPPYIRVIRPRFQWRTGHVTIGGSICMEVLTKSGWSPANSIEAMIISIRAQLIAGNARLNPSQRHDYTEYEAKEAFDRMVREHGW